MILDKKLSWKSHINYIKRRCMGKMNILKAISHTRWGANRALIIQSYKTLIRPIIDYGSFIYSNNLSKTLQTSLSRLQYSALRLALGALRNTVVQTLEAEAGILPLQFRSGKLGGKYLCKKLSMEKHPLQEVICSNGQLPQSTRIKGTLPVIITLLNSLKEFNINVDKITKVPDSPTKHSNFLCDLSLLQYNKKNVSQIIIQQEYRILKNQHSKMNTVVLSTDGSKALGQTACAVVCKEQVFKYKLPEYSSVFTAELYAIYIAIELTIQNNIENAIIVTDSLSSLQAIENYQSHFLIMRINEKLQHHKGNIIFLWVPSHMGIEDNEKADRAAGEAITSGVRIELGMTAQEACNVAANQISLRAKAMWQTQPFFTVKVNPEFKPDSVYKLLSRREQVILSRLRLNNCRFQNLHFFQPNTQIRKCKCGKVLNMLHIINCEVYKDEWKRVFKSLPQDEKNYIEILRVDNFDRRIFEFLKEIGIHADI